MFSTKLAMRSLVFLPLLLLACTSQKTSQLKQIKIQSGELLPAITVIGRNLPATLVTQEQPSLNCNQTDASGASIYLSENFNPATDNGGTDPGCPVYGYTEAYALGSSHPAWKVNSSPKSMIFLEGERNAYPLGRQLKPADDLALAVQVCTTPQSAGDTSGLGTCTGEKKDFFAKETAGFPAEERERLVGKAVFESLLILTYNDAGLNQCYEQALLATDKIEQQFENPYDSGRNIFRSIRQRGGIAPVLSDESAFMEGIVSTFGNQEKQAYALRALLALRLGYSSEPKSKVYEPFGDLTAEYNATAMNQLKNVVSADEAMELSSGLNNPNFFNDAAGMRGLLDETGREFYVMAKGYVDSVSNLPSSSIIVPESSEISTAKTKVLADLIYRAVLFAKASRLKPLEEFEKLKTSGMLKDSCLDYAKFRPGLSSPRDSLVKAYFINKDLNSSPAIAFGAFKGELVDSENQPYRSDELPLILTRSPECLSAGNPKSFCPIKWTITSSESNRYKALKVRIKNPSNFTHPQLEKTISIDEIKANGVLLSGADISFLESKNFFKLEIIKPTLEVEGILATSPEGIASSDLIFSSKMNRRPVACADYRVNDRAESKVPFGLKTSRCEANGSWMELSTSCLGSAVFSAVTNSCEIEQLSWVDAGKRFYHIRAGESLLPITFKAMGGTQEPVKYDVYGSCNWYQYEMREDGLKIWGKSPASGEYTDRTDVLKAGDDNICSIVIQAYTGSESIDFTVDVMIRVESPETEAHNLMWEDIPPAGRDYWYRPNREIEPLLFKARSTRPITYRFVHPETDTCSWYQVKELESGILINGKTPSVPLGATTCIIQVIADDGVAKIQRDIKMYIWSSF